MLRPGEVSAGWRSTYVGATDAYPDVRDLRDNVRDPDVEQEDHGLPQPALQEPVAAPQAVVKEITPAGLADVYNLHVPQTNALAVNGGVVVHNCYDAVSGYLKMRPWKPTKPKTEDELWRERAKKGGGSWMSN
jgi:hypothetical protein